MPATPSMPTDPFPEDQLGPAPDEHGWFSNGSLGRALGVDPRRVALYCSAWVSSPVPAALDGASTEADQPSNLHCTRRGPTPADDEWFMDLAAAETIKGLIRSKSIGLAYDPDAMQAWLYLNKRRTDIDGGALGRNAARAATQGPSDATGPLQRADAPTGSVDVVPAPLSVPVVGGQPYHGSPILGVATPAGDWGWHLEPPDRQPPTRAMLLGPFPDLAEPDSRFRWTPWVVTGCAVLFVLAVAKLTGWI